MRRFAQDGILNTDDRLYSNSRRRSPSPTRRSWRPTSTRSPPIARTCCLPEPRPTLGSRGAAGEMGSPTRRRTDGRFGARAVPGTEPPRPGIHAVAAPAESGVPLVRARKALWTEYETAMAMEPASCSRLLPLRNETGERSSSSCRRSWCPEQNTRSIMFVDNRARTVYGSCTSTTTTAMKRQPGCRRRDESHPHGLRQRHHGRPGGTRSLPSAASTLRRIKSVISARCRVFSPAHSRLCSGDPSMREGCRSGSSSGAPPLAPARCRARGWSPACASGSRRSPCFPSRTERRQRAHGRDQQS